MGVLPKGVEFLRQSGSPEPVCRRNSTPFGSTPTQEKAFLDYFPITFQSLMTYFLFGGCGNLYSFFPETRADQATNMCMITRSKCNGANTTKTKTNDKAGVSNDSLIDFLVKFVEENVPASIHGLHGCVNKGSAEPTQFSLQVFFSSTGGMSQLSHMQKLKCARVVSDNLH